MFSWFWSATPTKNISSLKEQAQSEAILSRSKLLQSACLDFKRLFPTQILPVFDEKQQLFNPWLNVSYDVLELILYFPKALALCQDILNSMEKLALDATKDTCSFNQLKIIHDKWLEYLTQYNNICFIDLPLYGKRSLNNGSLIIRLGNTNNHEYNIKLHPFDETSLSLNDVSLSYPDSARSALTIIQNARQKIEYNNILFVNHYQQDLEMLVAHIFIRITPLFNQLTLLEKIAGNATKTLPPNVTLERLNEQFSIALNELHAMQIIHSKYGKQQLGQGNFSLELGHYQNTISINLPTIDCPSNYINLLTVNNAKDAVEFIKQMKKTFMQSPYYTDISLKQALADDDSDEANYLRLLNRY